MHPSEQEFNFDQCSSCNLVYLNPRVSESELGEYYSKHYLPYRGASAWGKYANFVENSQKKMDRKRASVIGKYKQLTSKDLILDVGCGRPTFLEACAQKYDARLLGIDFSDHGWKSEGKRFEKLDLQVAEVKDLDKKTAPSVITMWHYLEHDYQPVENLTALRKIATDETLLVIEVPNFDSVSRKKYGKDWAGYHTPRHTFLFSPDNIRQLLKKTGWETLEIDTVGTLDPYNLFWMSEMEKQQVDWTKNMETEFFGYVRGMALFNFKNAFLPKKPQGIMTITARATSNG